MCYVRYGGAHDFVGRDDTSMPYLQRGTSGDARFLSARDDVLAELQQGVEVTAAPCWWSCSRASASECSTLPDVGGGAARGNGAALAGNVYLVPCSVRYWATDSYFRSWSQGRWAFRSDDVDPWRADVSHFREHHNSNR